MPRLAFGPVGQGPHLRQRVDYKNGVHDPVEPEPRALGCSAYSANAALQSVTKAVIAMAPRRLASHARSRAAVGSMSYYDARRVRLCVTVVIFGPYHATYLSG